MRNIKITIEYDGTDYHGWQYQPNRKTVQAEIEEALKKIFKKRIRIVGASRTDAGTHALGQVANFKIESRMRTESIGNAINTRLPRDIFVKKIEEAKKDFHARYAAVSKLYEYRIVLGRSPLRRQYAWELKYKIDLKMLARGLRKFSGPHDFTNFSAGSEKNNKTCHIKKVRLRKRGDEIVIAIEGDRFLNRMVRMMVGFLVDLGRGRFGFEVTEKMFDKDFKKNFLVAPAQGLYLVEVYYV